MMNSIDSNNMRMRRLIIFCFFLSILGSDLSSASFAAEDAVSVKDAPQKNVSIFPLGFFEGTTDLNIFVLHSGDKINISVSREAELSGSFTVNSLGKITYPLLGDIYVDGLSLDELKSFLADSLSQEYLVNPQIQITMEDSPNKSVTIFGQVAKPGNFIMAPNMTLLRLISQVGGFLNSASMNDVKIVRMNRNGKKISAQVDVQGIMKGESEDVILMPGDMVFVDKLDEKKEEAKKEIIQQVSVLGQIARPGNYNYTPGMTLVRLVSEAGGFTPIAAQNRVKIVRTVKDGPELSFQVDMRKVLEGKEKDVDLEPKDLIVIAESFF